MLWLRSTHLFHLFHESPHSPQLWLFAVAFQIWKTLCYSASRGGRSQQIVFVGFRLNVTRSLENKTCCTFGWMNLEWKKWQAGLPAGKPLPAPTNTTKHVQSFLGLNFSLSKKHWANTNTKSWTNSFWSRLFHKKEPLGTSAVSRLKTSPSRQPAARSKSSTWPGRWWWQAHTWLRSWFQLSLFAFSSTESLQFETHFPFIFLFCDFLKPTWKECDCHVGVGLHFVIPLPVQPHLCTKAKAQLFWWYLQGWSRASGFALSWCSCLNLKIFAKNTGWNIMTKQ